MHTAVFSQDSHEQRYSRALIDLGYRLSAARTPAEAGDIIVDVAQSLLGWDACTLDLLKAHTGEMQSVLTMDTIDGQRVDVPPAYSDTPPSRIAMQTIQEGAQLILRHQDTNPSSDYDDSAASEWRQIGDTSRRSASVIFVPIRFQQQVIGTLSIQSYTPDAYDASALAMLQGLADHCGGALERMRMEQTLSENEARLQTARQESEQRERRFREQLTILHEVSLELSKTVTPDALCRMAIELGRSRLGYDRLSLWFETEDPNRLRGTYGTDEHGETQDEKHFTVDSTVPSRQEMFRKGPAVVEQDWPLLDGSDRQIGRGWHMMAAVRDAENIIGVLNADNLLRQQPLQAHQPELLGLYGAMIGHLYAHLRSEEALCLSEEKFAKAFHASPDSITISTIEEGRYIDVNEGFIKMSGYSAREALGRTAHDLNIYVNPEKRGELIQTLLREGSVRDWDMGFRTKSGQILDCQTSVELIELYGQTRILAISRDVTERKRIERQAHQLNQELERRVQERTIQLEAANKELEAFSYSVSHDLRAPLRAMSGFARILMNNYASSMDADANHYLSRIQSNAEQMGHLIDELLTFSRLGRQSLKMQTVDMVTLVRQLVADLRTEQQGREIVFSIDTLPACQGDPGLLRQVLVNLLTNAIKFTRRRDVASIEIGYERQTEWPGNHTYFVRDNGVGFDAQYMDKLFGVFQRLHQAEEFEGSGVGLAIVKRIVSRHGGRVRAEGAIQQGATFYITLPAAQVN